MRELKPHIVHRQTAGGPEFPFVKPLDSFAKHLVSTAIFGSTDDTIDIIDTHY